MFYPGAPAGSSESRGRSAPYPYRATARERVTMPKRTDPDEVVDAQLSRRELTAAAVTQIERFGRAVDSYDWLNTADEWSAAELRAFRDAVAPMLTRAADMLEAAIGPDAEPCSVFAENPQSEADDADDE